jgi:hypothetical protein
VTSKPNCLITFKVVKFAPAPNSSISLFKNLLFICKEMKKCGCSSYFGLKWLACNIIGESKSSPYTLKNLSTLLLIEGIFMIYVRGIGTLIFSKMPFMSIFKSMSLVFGKVELGGIFFVGGGGGPG